MKADVPAAYFFAAITIIISILTILASFRGRRKSNLWYFIHSTHIILSTIIIFFVLPWTFLSIYLRWVVVGFILLGLFRTIRMRKLQTIVKSKSNILSRVFFISVSGFVFFLYVKGLFFYNPQKVNLYFPLRQGTYYVMQGGGSRLSNLMHGNYSWKRYGYALDMAKIFMNSGNRAIGISPSNVEDYAIYGDTLYSPTEGIVLDIVDSIADNRPGRIEVPEGVVHGNYILIQSIEDSFRVFIPHLQPKSAMVKVGQKLKRGKAFALLGNSGFSVEPHLHMQAIKDYPKDYKDPTDGTSVPMLFDNKFLSINETITYNTK